MNWADWVLAHKALLIAVALGALIVGAIVQAHSGPVHDCHYDYQHSFAKQDNTESEADYCKHWGQVPFPQAT